MVNTKYTSIIYEEKEGDSCTVEEVQVELGQWSEVGTSIWPGVANIGSAQRCRGWGMDELGKEGKEVLPQARGRAVCGHSEEDGEGVWRRGGIRFGCWLCGWPWRCRRIKWGG